MIVVDASVAAKWIMVEADTELANAVLAQHVHLSAPDLIAVEVAAAITRKVRVGDLPMATGEAYIASWQSWLRRGVLELASSTSLLEHAARWALELSHPLQDCLYLALAARHGADLVTADRTFVKRAQPRYPRIVMLQPQSASNSP